MKRRRNHDLILFILALLVEVILFGGVAAMTGLLAYLLQQIRDILA